MQASYCSSSQVTVEMSGVKRNPKRNKLCRFVWLVPPSMGGFAPLACLTTAVWGPVAHGTPIARALMTCGGVEFAPNRGEANHKRRSRGIAQPRLAGKLTAPVRAQALSASPTPGGPYKQHESRRRRARADPARHFLPFRDIDRSGSSAKPRLPFARHRCPAQTKASATKAAKIKLASSSSPETRSIENLPQVQSASSTAAPVRRVASLSPMAGFRGGREDGSGGPVEDHRGGVSLRKHEGRDGAPNLCGGGGNGSTAKKRVFNEIDSNIFRAACSGPGQIWRCPSTSSLGEEARANLNSMAKPGMWRNQSGSAVRQAARVELENMRERYKAEQKAQQKRGGNVQRFFVAALRAEMTEDERERWMKRRALMRPDRFTVGQKRELRKWFDCLDKDGSGEIDTSELSHPLLSTGIARSALEVSNLIRQVDKDGSGEIGFQEFLAILQHGGTPSVSESKPVKAGGGLSKAPKSAVDKIISLQEVQMAHGSDMETVLAIERRSLLMKEILDEAAYRDGAIAEYENERYVAERAGDQTMLRALKLKEVRLERRRVQKNLFIQAVSDATDFQKLVNLNEAALRRNRMTSQGAGYRSAPLSFGPNPISSPKGFDDETHRDSGEPHGPVEIPTTLTSTNTTADSAVVMACNPPPFTPFSSLTAAITRNAGSTAEESRRSSSYREHGEQRGVSTAAPAAAPPSPTSPSNTQAGMTRSGGGSSRIPMTITTSVSVHSAEVASPLTSGLVSAPATAAISIETPTTRASTSAGNHKANTSGGGASSRGGYPKNRGDRGVEASAGNAASERTARRAELGDAPAPSGRQDIPSSSLPARKAARLSDVSGRGDTADASTAAAATAAACSGCF